MKEPLLEVDTNVASINNAEPDTPSATTPNLYDNDELIGEVSFKTVLKYPVYRRFLFLFFITFLAFYERASFLSGYGAAYYGGCKTIKENSNCNKDFDYNKWNVLLQTATSIANTFALLSAPFIGTLSDKYGRKPFIIIQIIIYALPYLFIIIYNNISIFLILWTFQGLNGSTQISTPVTQAYISDILPNKLHIIGYALMYLLSGFGLLIGEFIGFAVSSIFNDHANFYVITTLYAICIIYLLIFIPESKKRKLSTMDNTNNNNNNNNISKYNNPCKSFTFCCTNRIVFWCSLIIALVTLPAMGLVDISTIVLADNFNANSNKQFNQLALLYIFGWAVGLIVGPIAVLPILRKYLTEFKIFIVSVIILMLAIVIFLIVMQLKIIYFIPITSFTLGLGFLSMAPINAILTKYTEKEDAGNAFGSLFAFGSVCNIIAPIGFAGLYSWMRSIGAPSLIFVVALLMLVITLISSLGLRKTIKDIDDENVRHFKFVRVEEKEQEI